METKLKSIMKMLIFILVTVIVSFFLLTGAIIIGGGYRNSYLYNIIGELNDSKITTEFESGVYVDEQLDVNGAVLDRLDLYRAVYSELTEDQFNYQGDDYDVYKRTRTSISLFDSMYYVLDMESFKRLVYHFDNTFTYTRQQMDCDKYSRIFHSFAVLSTTEDILHAGIGVGVINFYYENRDNDEKHGHSLNIILVMTDEDTYSNYNVYILEPQIATSTYVRNYVNGKTSWTEEQKIDYIFNTCVYTFEDYFDGYVQSYDEVYVGNVIY